MPRLVVNPNTPESWEIELKPGVNRIGRSEQNDFSINHSSISTFHCEFVVSDAGVMLKDLNSTRGTFVNGEMVVKEAFLQNGQHIQLGSVATIFEMPPEEDTSLFSSIDTDTIMRVPVLPPDIPALDQMPPPPEIAKVGAPSAVEMGFCKIHPKTPARFFCSKCQSYFCEPCVVAHAASACGAGITPDVLQVSPPAASINFFQQFPRAFLYPLKGSGLLILLASTLVFSGLAILNQPLYALIFQVVAACYLFSFLQEIVVCSAMSRGDIPELPGFTGFLRGWFCLAGTGLVAFGLALVLMLVRIYFEVGISLQLIGVAAALGCIYFPMAFLLATVKGTIAGANAAKVIAGISKSPTAYPIIVILFAAGLATGWQALLPTPPSADPAAPTENLLVILRAFGMRILWSFLAVYLLTVSMRALGLLFAAKGSTFGWYQNRESHPTT